MKSSVWNIFFVVRTSCRLLLDVGQGALAACLAVLVGSHEDTSAALGVGALHALVGDLDVLTLALDLVELQHAHLDVLVTVDGLLGLGEDLLLLLLALTSLNGDDAVDGGALLELALGNGHLVLEEGTSEVEVGINGELGLDLLNGGGRRDGDDLGGRNVLHEELHCSFRWFF
jgi:hypothetical protein